MIPPIRLLLDDSVVDILDGGKRLSQGCQRIVPCPSFYPQYLEGFKNNKIVACAVGDIVRLGNVETRLRIYKTLVIEGSFASGIHEDNVTW